LLQSADLAIQITKQKNDAPTKMEKKQSHKNGQKKTLRGLGQNPRLNFSNLWPTPPFPPRQTLTLHTNFDSPGTVIVSDHEDGWLHWT